MVTVGVVAVVGMGARVAFSELMLVVLLVLLVLMCLD